MKYFITTLLLVALPSIATAQDVPTLDELVAAQGKAIKINSTNINTLEDRLQALEEKCDNINECFCATNPTLGARFEQGGNLPSLIQTKTAPSALNEQVLTELVKQLLDRTTVAAPVASTVYSPSPVTSSRVVSVGQPVITSVGPERVVSSSWTSSSPSWSTMVAGTRVCNDPFCTDPTCPNKRTGFTTGYSTGNFVSNTSNSVGVMPVARGNRVSSNRRVICENGVCRLARVR